MDTQHCYVCGPSCEGAPRVYEVTYTRGPFVLRRSIGVCSLWTTERASREVRAVMEDLRDMAETFDTDNRARDEVNP